MGLLRNVILGRPDGMRARLCKKVLGRSTEPEKDPAAAPYTAPGGTGGWGAGPTAAEPALGLSPEAPKDVTPPDGFEVVLHKDALVAGRVVEIIVSGTAIAVANVDGHFYAVSNTCAHAGGPLGEGTLEGPILTCPYHGWAYDVRDGSCRTNPEVQIQKFDVVVEGEAVCVRV